MGDTVGLEADHRQCSALAQAGRKLGEAVIGTEQHAQTGQAMQILWQRAQSIAAEVEHFQRVRQIEDLLGKLGQAFCQIQPRDARQLAGTQLSKGMHEQIRH
ncbi:hypothetical protein D3C81_1929710 [compost metagenome]